MTRAELLAALLACAPAPTARQRESDYGDLDHVLTWDLGHGVGADIVIPPPGAGDPSYVVTLRADCSISGIVREEGFSLWMALGEAGITRGAA